MREQESMIAPASQTTSAGASLPACPSGARAPGTDQAIPAAQLIATDVVKQIAMDIGKDLVAYIEVQYPDAIKATTSTFRLAVRNHVYNQIMAALETTDEADILRRLAERKRFRRKWVGAYRKMRKQGGATDVE